MSYAELPSRALDLDRLVDTGFNTEPLSSIEVRTYKSSLKLLIVAYNI
jgi:hypothetical protein